MKSEILYVLVLFLGSNALEAQVPANYHINSNSILHIKKEVSPNIQLDYENPVKFDSALTNKNKIVSKNKCNIGTTIWISAIPGFLLHGAGHFYLKRYKTGLILLTLEGLSYVAAFAGRNQSSYTLFIGSYIYDIVASPIHCYRKNQKSKKLSIQPYIKNGMFGDRQTGIMLCIGF